MRGSEVYCFFMVFFVIIKDADWFWYQSLLVEFCSFFLHKTLVFYTIFLCESSVFC